MKRVLRAIWTIGSSRALPPLVLGFFLVVYIGIAFFTDETLIMLMAITRKSFFLTAVLALLPLNSMCRIVVEAGNYLKRRRALSDAAYAVPPALYDETVDPAQRLDAMNATSGHYKVVWKVRAITSSCCLRLRRVKLTAYPETRMVSCG